MGCTGYSETSFWDTSLSPMFVPYCYQVEKLGWGPGLITKILPLNSRACDGCSLLPQIGAEFFHQQDGVSAATSSYRFLKPSNGKVS